MTIEVWPVIHVRTQWEALSNANKAINAGVDGIFLISHVGNNMLLDDCRRTIHREIPALTIGVNYLGESPGMAALRARREGYASVWIDDAGVMSGIPDGRTLEMVRVDSAVTMFTGFAFKGRQVDGNPPASAYTLAKCGYIPTTSGPATGEPPTLEKIEGIRRVLDPEMPLAVASGLTPDNVADFHELITHALVATGISHDFYNFNELLLARFMEACR